MPRINSRQKGAEGEREFARLLSRFGYPAYRGRQFSATPESPDVRCDILQRLHFEVKRVQKLDLYEALTQSARDAGRSNGVKHPLVAHRTNRGKWLITIDAEIFLKYFAPFFKEDNAQQSRIQPTTTSET